MIKTFKFSLLLALAVGVGERASHAADSASEQIRRDRIVVEAIMRLENIDIREDPKLLQTVERYLSQMKSDPAQLKIIQKLKLTGFGERLVDLALLWGESSQSVQAIDLAVNQGGMKKIATALKSKMPDEPSLALSKIVALSNSKQVHELQRSLLADANVAKAIKVDAAVGMSRSKGLHAQVIELAKANLIPTEANILIGATLRNSEDEGVRKAANEMFPPAKSSQTPLPPIDALVKRTGNPVQGKTLYIGVATCSQCHMVGQEGKNVGPSLTEIGSKLSKDAMYAAILAPSAGISHNYETFAVRTDEDEVVTGLMVSDTAESVTIRDAKGIDRTIQKTSVEEMKKLEKSLMPEGLQETMSEQGLVDLVEYLISLKKS